jgi:hypothetical protein
MSIIKNFDMEALRKKRAKASGGTTDLVAALREISPDIEKLEVGETARIKVPESVKVRAHVMSITAKLSNLTPKGAPWAGRQFKVLNDGEGSTYVQRAPDLKKADIKERKRGSGGGRPKKTETVAGATTEAKPETPAQAPEGAKVTEHA